MINSWWYLSRVFIRLCLMRYMGVSLLCNNNSDHNNIHLLLPTRCRRDINNLSTCSRSVISYISAILSHVLIDTVLKLLSYNSLYSCRRNMYHQSKLLHLLLLYPNKLRHGLSIQLMVCYCILFREERRCVHYIYIYVCWRGLRVCNSSMFKNILILYCSLWTQVATSIGIMLQLECLPGKDLLVSSN